MAQDKTRPPTKTPPPPRHPGDDAAMPPYTPGGVPEPKEREPASDHEPGKAPPSVYPPKRDP